MNTWLYEESGRTVGRHAIDIVESAGDIVLRSFVTVEHSVAWPHMWHPGDPVTATLADGLTCPGVVLAVSEETAKVLIQLGHSIAHEAWQE